MHKSYDLVITLYDIYSSLPSSPRIQFYIEYRTTQYNVYYADRKNLTLAVINIAADVLQSDCGGLCQEKLSLQPENWGMTGDAAQWKVLNQLGHQQRCFSQALQVHLRVYEARAGAATTFSRWRDSIIAMARPVCQLTWCTAREFHCNAAAPKYCAAIVLCRNSC